MFLLIFKKNKKLCPTLKSNNFLFKKIQCLQPIPVTLKKDLNIFKFKKCLDFFKLFRKK